MLVPTVPPGSVVEDVRVRVRALGVTLPGCSMFLIQSIVYKKAVGRVPQAVMQFRKSDLAGVTG